MAVPHDDRRTIEVLLVEDNVGDVRLTREALAESKLKIRLSTVADGVDAMMFLRKEGTFKDAATPDLILLDLNLPRKDGRQVLAEIKADGTLRHLPVVILTSSSADDDVLRSYNLHANCYVVKPVGLPEFLKIVQSIENFWLEVVVLPPELAAARSRAL